MLEFLISQIITEMKSLIIKIRLSEAQTTNKCLLKKDEKILKSSFNSENDEKLNNKKIIIFDEKKDYELVRALEDVLLMLLSSEVDIEITFHIQLLIRMNDQHHDKRDLERVFSEISQKIFVEILLDQTSYKICFQKVKDQEEKLKDFNVKKIISIFNKVFITE